MSNLIGGLNFSGFSLEENEGNGDQIINYTCIPASYLANISLNNRSILFWCFIIVTTASSVANLAAIYSITKRKFRVIQKTCIISLALSDFLSTLTIGVNNISSLRYDILIWELGSFLCGFIPMAQTAGIIASSLALTLIALDRYRNVVHALSRRWNPSLTKCLSMSIFLWVSGFAVSYPMYDLFEFWNVAVLYTKENENGTLEFDSLVPADICLSLRKFDLRIYYILISILIFLPSFVIFLWFYYKIAVIVWKHRKPISIVFNKKDKKSNTEFESSTNNTKTTEISETNTKSPPKVKKRDIRVERKIRTFKIILSLMTVFILCRFPYYIISVYKISLPNEESGEGLWIWSYVSLVLQILNCFLNPLLYTFLNTTLKIYEKIKKVVKDFIWEICCFCFSNAEFEEFEKENPFVVNNEPQKRESRSVRSSRVKFVEEVNDNDTSHSKY